MKSWARLRGPVQVVVLAGGQGTRLRPLTYETPKPLLPIMGRPMVAHLLASLPAACDTVFLTVSHRAKDLSDWVGGDDPALEGREVVVVEETKPLGTGGAVANCADHLDGTVLVLNGDLLSEVPYDRLAARHEHADAVATIALHRVHDPSRFGVVDMDAEARVRAFIEKPAPKTAPSDLVNAGAYLLEPEAIEAIPRGGPVSIEREVFPVLADTHRGLYGLPFEGLWIDCGTRESYLAVHKALATRAAGGAVDPTGWRAPRAGTAPDVYLEDSVLLDGARIGAGSAVLDSIIGSNAVVGARCRLESCIVGPGEVVEDGTHARGRRFGLRGLADDPPGGR